MYFVRNIEWEMTAMNILIVNNTVIPALLYGGTERVIWDLGEGLTELGHHVTFLVKKGSSCPFAHVIFIDEANDLIEQIPKNMDVVHFNFAPENLSKLNIPYIITMHGNRNDIMPFDLNTVFVSENHANRYQSTSFVYNGLNWNRYAKPDLNRKRNHFHFLGNAAWRVKNVRGAINIICKTKRERLHVLGGVRFNVNMGIRFTFSPRITFHGMVGEKIKEKILNSSKGLIFPVLWHEPFGLAIIESLYFGCPVFGTLYGSLPEIVGENLGFCSNNMKELIQAIQHSDSIDPKHCYEYANEQFNHLKMAYAYLEKYESVLSNEKLNMEAPVLQKIQEEKFLAVT